MGEDMEESIEVIKNRIKSKRHFDFRKKPLKKTYISNLFSRVLIAIILLLISVIFINLSNENLLMYKKYVFTDSLKFSKINAWYNKTFGESALFKGVVAEKTTAVFNEKLVYTSASMFYDGASLVVGENYLVPTKASGIVVFMGDKDNFGSTIIIQGIDGIDYWYGNIKNSNVKMYEYVESGSLLGETMTEELYMAFVKDGVFLNYEDYI